MFRATIHPFCFGTGSVRFVLLGSVVIGQARWHGSPVIEAAGLFHQVLDSGPPDPDERLPRPIALAARVSAEHVGTDERLGRVATRAE
jgi:hypothetical protein